MIKAPLAQQAVGPNPTDRRKNGSKRHLLVDGRGVPLSLIVTGANRHHVSHLEAVLDAMMVKRPPAPPRRHKHLCVDAGYALTRSSLGSLDAGMSDDARVNWLKTMAKKRVRTALTSGGLQPVLDEGGGRTTYSPSPSWMCWRATTRPWKGSGSTGNCPPGS